MRAQKTQSALIRTCYTSTCLKQMEDLGFAYIFF